MKALRSPLAIAALACAVLPFALLAGGLTLTSATDVVIFTVACMALNILVGHTGLVSFGHGAWFGLGAYAGINVVLASFYPHHLRALGIGMTKSIGRVGTVIAPVLIGFGLDAGMQQTMVMSLFAAPAVLAAVALLVIAATRRVME